MMLQHAFTFCLEYHSENRSVCDRPEYRHQDTDDQLQQQGNQATGLQMHIQQEGQHDENNGQDCEDPSHGTNRIRFFIIV